MASGALALQLETFAAERRCYKEEGETGAGRGCLSIYIRGGGMEVEGRKAKALQSRKAKG